MQETITCGNCPLADVEVAGVVHESMPARQVSSFERCRIIGIIVMSNFDDLEKKEGDTSFRSDIEAIPPQVYRIHPAFWEVLML